MPTHWIIAALIFWTPVWSFAFSLDLGRPPASKHLRWPGNTVKIAISSSLLTSNGAIKPQSDVNVALLKALQKWETASNITFEIIISDASSISPHGVVGDGISLITVAADAENLLAFSGRMANASAVTRVFHDNKRSIIEADIALNPTQQFTTDQTPGMFDLETVLTHEIGHLLGLRHSIDPSAIMFDGVPRNGGFEPINVLTSLSGDDISRVRSLYGVAELDKECCAVIRGRVINNLDASETQLIWVQNARTGSLAQLRTATGKGVFEFGGLELGGYDVITQNVSSDNPFAATVSAAVRAHFEPGPSKSVEARGRPVSFDLQFIGINGQLSKRAISVEVGNTYRLALAGPGIKDVGLRFGVTSPAIRLETVRAEPADFVKGLPVRFFDVTVTSTVMPGRYSIFAEDQNNLRRYFVGAIAVE